MPATAHLETSLQEPRMVHIRNHIHKQSAGLRRKQLVTISLGNFCSDTELGKMVHTCDPSTYSVEAGGSGIQGQPGARWDCVLVENKEAMEKRNQEWERERLNDSWDQWEQLSSWAYGEHLTQCRHIAVVPVFSLLDSKRIESHFLELPSCLVYESNVIFILQPTAVDFTSKIFIQSLVSSLKKLSNVWYMTPPAHHKALRVAFANCNYYW